MTTTEQAAPPQKSKVEKAQSYMVLASTTLGVLGVIGSGFVWVAANFMVGDVYINADKPVPALMVKVVDSKGLQHIFYNNTVPLMPGDYHLEFGIPDKKPTVHRDVHVTLWQRTEIPYAVPADLVDDQPNVDDSDKPGKKKWWQFWKHSK